MTSDLVARYCALIDDCHRIIDAPGWWDGPYRECANELAALWDRMTPKQQAEANAHANAAYQRRINR